MDWGSAKKHTAQHILLALRSFSGFLFPYYVSYVDDNEHAGDMGVYLENSVNMQNSIETR